MEYLNFLELYFCHGSGVGVGVGVGVGLGTGVGVGEAAGVGLGASDGVVDAAATSLGAGDAGPSVEVTDGAHPTRAAASTMWAKVGLRTMDLSVAMPSSARRPTASAIQSSRLRLVILQTDEPEHVASG
jgi:hypothetical protein